MKEFIPKQPNKSPMVFKSLGTTDLVITFVVQDQLSKLCRYINQNDLRVWGIKEKELYTISKQNLGRLAEEVSSKNNGLFNETQTGVYFSNMLGQFSASLVLLPNLFTQLAVPEKNRVMQLVSNDLLLLADSCDAMSTCVMGEMSLRLVSCKQFLSLQPIRYLNTWFPYEPIKVEHQFPIPVNKDEIKIYKKAIFRK